MTKKKFVLAMIAAFSLSLSGPSLHRIVSAEENDIQRLQQKIYKLEERVQCLEALLDKYQINDSKQTPMVSGWENKKNWRKLELGMTESQVQDILGDPAKMIKGVRTLWYYPNKYCGYVSFDEKGHLLRWNEP